MTAAPAGRKPRRKISRSIAIPAPVSATSIDGRDGLRIHLDRFDRCDFGGLIARGVFTISAGSVTIGSFRIDGFSAPGTPFFVKPKATWNRFTSCYDASCDLDPAVLEVIREAFIARLEIDDGEGSLAT